MKEAGENARGAADLRGRCAVEGCGLSGAERAVLALRAVLDLLCPDGAACEHAPLVQPGAPAGRMAAAPGTFACCMWGRWTLLAGLRPADADSTGTCPAEGAT
jgi:hypothetical protein